MRQAQTEITVETPGRGLIDVTRPVRAFASEGGIVDGLMTVFCRHTSCSLIVQENADPNVQRDLEDFLARLVPEDPSRYRHGAEGPDDMPAHIRTVLTLTSLSVPVAGGAPVFGAWQGLYLFEHRARPHRRRLALHLLGS